MYMMTIIINIKIINYDDDDDDDNNIMSVPVAARSKA
jgi:hypothetical protein